MLNVENVVKRWAGRTGSQEAKNKYIEKIDAVTESPMAKAAAADDFFLARVQESVNSGKRREKLLATPMSRWKDNAKKKGAERLASGATAAVEKVRAHFQKWGPVYEQIKAEVANMPKGGRAAAKARSEKAIDMLMDAAGRQ